MTEDGGDRAEADVGPRLDALDRRLGGTNQAPDRRDGDHPSGPDDARSQNRRPLDPEDRTAEPDDRLDDLEARVQALEGYVGEIEAVNDRVRARAETALARTADLSEPQHPDPTVEHATAPEPNDIAESTSPEPADPTGRATGRSATSVPDRRPPEHATDGPTDPRSRSPPAQGAERSDWPPAAEIRSRGLLARLLDRW